MFKFTIANNLSKNNDVIIFDAYKLNTTKLINKKIFSINNYNFCSGNSYKCNIEKEDDNYIYIQNVEQIGVDINIINKYKQKLKKIVDTEDLDNYLKLNSIEEIKKEIDNKKVQKLIIEAYNKNNLVKLLNNNFIILTEDEKYKIDNVVKELSNIDIGEMFIKKPYKLLYYFIEKTFPNLKDIKIIKKNDINYCKIILILKMEEVKGQAFTYTKIIQEKMKTNKKLIEDLQFLEGEELITLKKDKVYLRNTYLSEKTLIDNLRKRMKMDKSKLNKIEVGIIDDIINNSGTKLNKEQKKSIYEATKNNITIINGKAGTGKSTTLKYIVKAIKAINPNDKIEIISLSGKAVNVIDTKINNNDIEPKTIHRLFNFYGNNYSTAKKIKVLDYLIIDEMSMIDLALLSKVLELIPLEAKVIFCGDLGQIPPIGIGTPIKDILNSKKFKNIELIVNNRQGTNLISKNSIKILENNSDLEYKNSEFELINKEDKNCIILKNKVQSLLKEGYNFDDIMIITHSNFFTNKINNVIKELVFKEYRYKDSFTIGDKVMQTKNNYDKKVFNGEIGKIILFRRGINKSIDVLFNDRVVTYSSQELKELDFAYSVTVNKSQGSQSKIVIFYIGKEDEKYLNSNIIYTAITRAEEKCIIIGKEEIFNKVICKLPEEKKSSILEELLKIA